MKLYRFDVEAGEKISAYESSGFKISRVARLFEEAHLNCAHLDPGGVIGRHQAVIPQLFMIVQGEGWVRIDGSDKTPVQAGMAVYWEKGEWHESGTKTGMMVVIVEAVQIDTARMMPAL